MPPRYVGLPLRVWGVGDYDGDGGNGDDGDDAGDDAADDG